MHGASGGLLVAVGGKRRGGSWAAASTTARAQSTLESVGLVQWTLRDGRGVQGEVGGERGPALTQQPLVEGPRCAVPVLCMDPENNPMVTNRVLPTRLSGHSSGCGIKDPHP